MLIREFMNFLNLYNRTNPVVLDKDSKFIFIPNNKVAQTSIVRNVLRNRCIVKKDNSLRWHLHFLKTIFLLPFRKYYTFTVVRNSYAMVFSAFNYVKYKLNHTELNKYDDFNCFVKELLSRKREAIDPHFLPQSEKIDSYISKEINVNYLETLNSTWGGILQAIDEPYVELPQANTSIISIQKYEDSYNKDSYDIVYKLYKSCFDSFGYDK